MAKEIADLLYEFNTRADITIESLADLISDIAEPVRHGHWIVECETEDGIAERCSECRMVFYVGKGRDGHYCPNCGAKMDERREDGNDPKPV